MEAAEKINVPIESILCFGLGSFKRTESAKIRSSISMDQHFAVLDMAKILQAKAPETKIMTLFHDSLYTWYDKDYLWDLGESMGVSVSFQPSTTGLCKLGPKSFVFSPGRATFPIQQLVADLTVDFSGPAVLFWPTVRAARLHTAADVGAQRYTEQDEVNDWAEFKFNCPNRHVVEMLKDYDEILDTEQVTKEPSLYKSSLYVKRKDTS